jgi:Ran-binding protein 3
MAAEREAAVTSDTESSEKHTREQLKKASISKAAGEARVATEEGVDDPATAETNGEKTEEDVTGSSTEESKTMEDSGDQPTRQEVNARARHHSRKRSRDSTAEEDELNNGQRKSGERARGEGEGVSDVTSNGVSSATADRPRTPEQAGDKRGEAAVESMTSPRTKRSRLQSEPEKTRDASKSVVGDLAAAEDTAATAKSETGEKAATPIPPTSGFANTSALSPFAALAGSRSPPSNTSQTSSSAFTASGFGSLSASATSGFGALGKTSGGFGTGGSFASNPSTKTEATAAKPEQKSAFGGSLGQQSTFSTTAANNGASVFSSALNAPASGFGKLGQGSAFGGSAFSSLNSGGGLTSFASGKPSSSLASSSKTPKVFGAVADEEEDPEDGSGEPDADDSGFKSPLSQNSDKQDERFYAQNHATGEEDEKTEYSCRAKLYNFVVGADGKKEWKERGLGVVRLNCKRPSAENPDEKTTARLVMRAEGSHRVILNTPVKKEIRFGAPDGGPPQGGYLYFMGAVEGGSGLEMLQLKVSVASFPGFVFCLCANSDL